MASRLRQRLERSNSTELVLFPVTLSRVFGVSATVLRWKGEEIEDEKESETAEGRSSKIRQGFVKTTRPRETGKGDSLHH